VEAKVLDISRLLSDRAKILFNALVILLDLANNSITNAFVQGKFQSLARLVDALPFSEKPIKADLQDARSMPLQDGEVDFILTSPPYINVFNYHQNYRRSAEVLGWDLLRVARSEIGSNRANRGNRFYTVVQYCVDMATALYEISRVLTGQGRALFVVGHESRVLGVPFYNARLIERIAVESSLFAVALRQRREFVNRFGESIREDILNLVRMPGMTRIEDALKVARYTARDALEEGLNTVPHQNRGLLSDVLSRVHEIPGTPIFNSFRYQEYQTRDLVMMVKEEEEAK
jgi:hypothetical protein